MDRNEIAKYLVEHFAGEGTKTYQHIDQSISKSLTWDDMALAVEPIFTAAQERIRELEEAVKQSIESHENLIAIDALPHQAWIDRAIELAEGWTEVLEGKE